MDQGVATGDTYAVALPPRLEHGKFLSNLL
jgi:hypothetical protein